MRIVGGALYVGPNPFGRRPLVRMSVDFGPLADRPTASLPAAFHARLGAAVPRAVFARTGGAGSTLPDLVAALAYALQRAVGDAASTAAPSRDRRSTVRHLLIGYEDGEVGRSAAALALALVRHALPPDDPALSPMHAPIDTAAALRSFRALTRARRSDDALRTIARAAQRRGIPVRRLEPPPALQLGHGRRQRRIDGPTDLSDLPTDGAACRIPIAAITGSNGKTTTARMVARIMRRTAAVVGLATTTGASVDDRVLRAGDLAGVDGAWAILGDPTVDVAVLECARGGILRRGLGFDRCRVGAVLNVEDDHVGMSGVETADGLAVVKRVVVDAADDLAVLNAADPRCVAMQAKRTARRLCWVLPDGTPPASLPATGDVLARVVGDGPDRAIAIRDGGSDNLIAAVADLPSADGGRARHNVDNAVFAAAIAWGLGARAPAIAAGLADFDLSYETTHGRLSVYDGLPFRVVVDYGHNAGAIAAMARYAAAQPVAGRRLCMLNAPANRVAAHYRSVAAAAAGTFDAFFCTGPDALRGRAPGEVAGLLADALRAIGVESARIAAVAREEDAVPAALATARAGDLVVLFCCDPDRSWRQVRAHRP